MQVGQGPSGSNTSCQVTEHRLKEWVALGDVNRCACGDVCKKCFRCAKRAVSNADERLAFTNPRRSRPDIWTLRVYTNDIALELLAPPACAPSEVPEVS